MTPEVARFFGIQDLWGSSDFTIGGGLKQALDLWDAQKMGRSITKKYQSSTY